LAARLEWPLAAYAGAGLLANAVLDVALIPTLGFVAAAWVTLVAQAVVVTLIMRHTMRVTAMTLSLGRSVRTLAAAGVSAAVLVGLRSVGIPLGGLVAALAITYPAAVLLTRAVTREQLRLLIGIGPAR